MATTLHPPQACEITPPWLAGVMPTRNALLTSQHLIFVILQLVHSILSVSAKGSSCFGPDFGFHGGHLTEAGPLEQHGDEGRIHQQRQHHNAGSPHGDLQRGRAFSWRR